MRRRASSFWTGFGIGAAAGAVSVVLPQLIGRAGASRIIRLEKSIQVGRPVEEVFSAWQDWDRLARASDTVSSIHREGDRLHWTLQMNGRLIDWDATVEQMIPNQAIGWKSVRGPKHSGRITFAPIGDSTIVLVTMNYVPPARVLRPVLAPMAGHIEGMIEKVLRDFKASVESRPKGVQGIRTESEQIGPGTNMSGLPRTGTFGNEPRMSEPRFGAATNPLDYGNPSDPKR